ncbi:SDR family NAD(P)-dependent oxidoreductase [Nakamurella sp. YIM 132087]|uniref:SDR family NAD(P)-dependent oxidoreductase n=1 Tax=Nakamurella alba TaxID=2665158 RepID=A0A7K1FSA2_9ACTN|nr:SDR family oxidoreductase [Nakamurella alba]MTD16950.1 SDR family NAD(P)-dependent oxidoreductase [Nakamurella alba]
MPFTPSRTLITGASSGIGAGFARTFAARGSDLVLVARREDRLRELAAELTARHGIRAQVLPADLAEPDAGRLLIEQVDGEVDLLVNNAGFATHGPLAESDAARIENEIDVDVRALVSLTRAFLPGMIARRSGAIVNLASTASFQPLPGMAVYGAAKAFVRTFSEAVWQEARPHGVKVFALSPGPTRTEFFDVVGTESAAVGTMRDVDQVIATALRALDSRRTPPGVVDGRANALVAWSTRLVPRRILIPMTARMLG